MPIAGYRPTGSHPAVIAACFSLRATEKKHDRPKKKVGSRCLFHEAHPGAVSKVAYAHHNNNRNVLDEWVFGFQGTNPSIKR